MQITIDLPDNLSLTETAIRTELAIVLFQQKILLIEQSAQLIAINDGIASISINYCRS
jgi:predicted HTH domain antitoxin